MVFFVIFPANPSYNRIENPSVFKSCTYVIVERKQFV